MNRKIKFKGLLTAGDNKEINVLVSGVVVYEHGQLGCPADALTKALEGSEWSWNGDEFIRNDGQEDADIIDGGEFNISGADEWVYFYGLPLQFTGHLDKNDIEVYEGDVIKTPLNNICEIRWMKVVESVAQSDIIEHFEYTGFAAFHISQKRGYHLDDSLFAGEIIGNVHTTPELMPNLEK